MKIRKALVSLLMISTISVSSIVFAQDAETLSRQAIEAYTRKEYDKSAELFISAIKQGGKNTDNYYNCACSLALAGRKDEAFSYLTECLKLGYANVEHLKSDSDLDSLHADGRWQTVVDKCAANSKVQKMTWDNPALNTPFRENLSEEEKIAGLSKFWSEVRYNFANFDLVANLNWDALYLAYLTKIRQTKSTAEYYRLLMEMCAQLKDGHTNVLPPQELVDEIAARPLIRSRLIEGRVILTKVFDEALQKDGILPGLEVLEVNGVPVKQYSEQRVMPFQSASTKQDLETRGYEYALFAGPVKEALELTLQTSDGKSFKKIVPRLTAADRTKAMKNVPQVAPMEFKVLPGNVGYVALNTFENDTVVKQFEAAYAEIEKTEALIIDVRNNGGGTSGFGYSILAYLTDKPFKTSQWKTRNYRPSFRAWGRPEGWYSEPVSESPAKGSKLYAKPVVVLTSPRTFSAAEDFTVAFDVMQRGKLIGEATGGSTGQPLFFNLPGGGSARVCTKRDTYPDGKEFVGVGIQPHLAVQPTVKDFRAGRDTVLEAALDELKKMRNR
jgi:C-terminal processing protease CtpA/Prc